MGRRGGPRRIGGRASGTGDTTPLYSTRDEGVERSVEMGYREMGYREMERSLCGESWDADSGMGYAACDCT